MEERTETAVKGSPDSREQEDGAFLPCMSNCPSQSCSPIMKWQLPLRRLHAGY